MNWNTIDTLPFGRFILLWSKREAYPVIHWFTEGEAITQRKNPDLVYSHWAEVHAPKVQEPAQ